MRVAVVTTSYPDFPGDPSGHFVQAEVSTLKDAGHDVEVIAPKAGGAFGWPGIAARVKAFPPRLLEVGSFVRRARAVVERGGFDLVVAHWAVPSAFPVAMSARCRSPLEVVSHGADVRLLAGMPKAAREALVGKIAARAGTWRFVSHSLLESLTSKLGPEARRELERVAMVVAPPLELPPIAAADVAERRATSGELYVSVGRLVFKKRVDRVVEHVAEQRRAGRELSLVVVGDGPERPKLVRLASTLEVPARFVGKTTHADALAWMAAADALAFASEEEGLSTVLREAAALGTHVVHV